MKVRISVAKYKNYLIENAEDDWINSFSRENNSFDLHRELDKPEKREQFEQYITEEDVKELLDSYYSEILFKTEPLLISGMIEGTLWSYINKEDIYT